MTISPSWISLYDAKWGVRHAKNGDGASHLPIVTQDDNTDVIGLQVESHSLDSRLELDHLTGLNLGETEDSGDTITDGDDGSELLQVVLNRGKTGG